MSIVQLIRAGTLDAFLASVLWLLVEGRVPVIVAAGPRLVGKTTVLTALLEFLPPDIERRELRGWDEDFSWLPEAGRLGWLHAPERGGRPASERPSTPAATYLVAAELSEHLPFYTWGEQARVALRAMGLGYGLGATIHADSLQEVFDELRAPDVALTDDELSRLGVVLILRALRGEDGRRIRRIAVAHFVRPLARDAGGHLQRLAPAVLATWDPAHDTFEHFSWGVIPELASRVGRRPGDFESEQTRRAEVLTALAAAGIESVPEVRAAIQSYRLHPATQQS
jgi:hypothetical protein